MPHTAPTTRRGFTLIEILIVMVIVAILAAIGIPKYNVAKQRALATKIATEMSSLRSIAVVSFGSSGSWPEDTPEGEMPFAFASAGGAGIPFRNAGYRFDWDIVTVTVDGVPVPHAVLTVRTDDPALLALIKARLNGSDADLESSDSFTWIIEAARAVAANTPLAPPPGGTPLDPNDPAAGGSGNAGGSGGGDDVASSSGGGAGSGAGAGNTANSGGAASGNAGNAGADAGNPGTASTGQAPPGNACNTPAGRSNPACTGTPPVLPGGVPPAQDDTSKKDDKDKDDKGKTTGRGGRGGGD